MAPSGTCSKAGTPWTEQYNKVRRIHTEYRALPHGGEKISVIGMGSSVIGGGNRQQLRQVEQSTQEGSRLTAELLLNHIGQQRGDEQAENSRDDHDGDIDPE